MWTVDRVAQINSGEPEGVRIGNVNRRHHQHHFFEGERSKLLTKENRWPDSK